MEHINSYCHEPSIPPDDKARISPAYQHARDSYAFARLVEHVLTPDTLAGDVTGLVCVIAALRFEITVAYTSASCAAQYVCVYSHHII